MQLPLVQAAQEVERVRLPALAASWVKGALGSLPPAEKLATCHACVKLPAPGEARTAEHFNPDTKCCTYLPILHNFQVGALLDDPEVSAAGRASVERRIDYGVGVTPLGLLGNHAYYSRYNDQTFGRDADLLCPHYDEREGGRCGVWQHRNATCATWYCRCDRGVASFAFWRHGLQGLLRASEDVVANWAVFSLGAEADDWGLWADRRAFFRASARVAKGLTWDTLVTLGGAQLGVAADQARRLYGELLEAPLDPEWSGKEEAHGPGESGAASELPAEAPSVS
jgi:hypothetical protein